jgi:MHS family alpha-ketoglutarate permease-like MFS transporter
MHRRPSSRANLRSILSGSAGNLVEYFDWYVYASFSLYFAPVFFPSGSRTVQLMNTAAVFAIGFLVRPIGGLLLGGLADRKGRKTALIFSVLLMGGGSLLIVLTPGYDRIGMFAPAMLLFARILQGISLGGEYGTSATYLSEIAPAHRRGFYSSFQYVTIIMGQLLALGLLILLQRALLTEQQLSDWGWRIAFLVGAVLSAFAIYLRRTMEEPEAFTRARSSPRRGDLRELLRYPRELFTVLALTAGGTVSFYCFTTYMQKYLVNTTGFTTADATLMASIALLVFMIIQPLFGLLSDFTGRRAMLIAFGVLATLFTVPILSALAVPQSFGSALGWYLAGVLITTGYTSINAIFKAELFPVHVRALGVALPFAIAVSLFGGTAEYVALWLKNAGHEEWFYYYVSALACFCLIVSLTMKDTKATSRLDRDDIVDEAAPALADPVV